MRGEGEGEGEGRDRAASSVEVEVADAAKSEPELIAVEAGGARGDVYRANRDRLVAQRVGKFPSWGARCQTSTDFYRLVHITV